MNLVLFLLTGLFLIKHCGGQDGVLQCDNCLDTNHGSGCNNEAAQSCVCSIDPNCCSKDWDSWCVLAVTHEEKCNFTCREEPCGDCLTAHSKKGCSNKRIESCVCEMDPSCCNNEWDSLCVEEVQRYEWCWRGGCDIDDCADSPCVNGGTCTDGVNSFTCNCAPDYNGETCANNIDDCADSPCVNGGTCTDGVNSFTCDCAPGYNGETCATANNCSFQGLFDDPEVFLYTPVRCAGLDCSVTACHCSDTPCDCTLEDGLQADIHPADCIYTDTICVFEGGVIKDVFPPSPFTCTNGVLTTKDFRTGATRTIDAGSVITCSRSFQSCD